MNRHPIPALHALRTRTWRFGVRACPYGRLDAALIHAVGSYLNHRMVPQREGESLPVQLARMGAPAEPRRPARARTPEPNPERQRAGRSGCVPGGDRANTFPRAAKTGQSRPSWPVQSGIPTIRVRPSNPCHPWPSNPTPRLKPAKTGHVLAILAAVALACASLHAAPTKTAPKAAVAFSPDGALLAVAGYREVTILDAQTGKPKTTLTGAPGAVNAVTFSPDGSRVAGAGGIPGRSGEIRIWNVAGGKARVLPGFHKDAVLTLAWSPDGKTLAAGSYDRLASLWNVATGQGRPLKDHTDAVYGTAFSPDGRLLATVSGDRTLKMWDVASGKRLYTLGESTAELYCVAFHPSGRQVAAGGVDKSLRQWSITPTAGTLERSAFAHDGALLRVLYTPDGSGVITAGEDRSVKLWDAATLLEKKVLERQPDWPLGLALSADAKRLAVTRYNGSLALYDAHTGNPLFKRASDTGKKASR